MPVAHQVREFDRSFNAMLGVVTIASDPTLYQRGLQSRDAFIAGRRAARRQRAAEKGAFLNSGAA